ncbi:MAG: DUF2497 domain-containing protein [Litorimonas sp.]
MSEQTPEAAMDASEPSMEDILASIRKIIADDDAPVDVPSDSVEIDNSMDDFGNVNDLVSAQETQLVEDIPAVEGLSAVQDIGVENSDLQLEAHDDASYEMQDAVTNTIDLEIPDAEPLVSEVLPDDIPLETDIIVDLDDTENLALESNVMDELLADSTLSQETTIELGEDSDLALDTNLTGEADTVLEAAVTDIASIEASEPYDVLEEFDLEADLGDVVDIEIPMPDPNETDLQGSSDSELITRLGLGGLGAMAGGAVAAGATAFVGEQDEPIGEAEGTELLGDVELTVEPELLSSPAINTDLDSVEITSIDVDQVNDDSLDLNVMFDDGEELQELGITSLEAAPLERVAFEDIVPNEPLFDLPSDIGAISKDDVSDGELNALLADMDEEPQSFERLIPEGNDSVEGQEAVSEEDVDLLLVKSLMADLTDYDADVDVADVEADTAEVSSDKATIEAVAPIELEELTQQDVLIHQVDLQSDTAVTELSSDISDISDESNLSDIPSDVDMDDDAILDEILSLALEDEMESTSGLDAIRAEDIAELELENHVENEKLNALLPDSFEDNLDLSDSDDGNMSLASIAAAAQADANAADSQFDIKNIGLDAILAGVGATAVAGGAILTKQADDEDDLDLVSFDPDELDVEQSERDDVERILSRLLDSDTTTDTENLTGDISEETRFDAEDFATDATTQDVEEILTPDVTQNATEQATNTSESLNRIETIQEITDMPRAAAKNTDIIMDDVTETAAASVFAELNQVVEEKAIVAERGDRVGDLVMEALRPMLKDWLDANLKGIVERAVTKEVKRISSGK